MLDRNSPQPGRLKSCVMAALVFGLALACYWPALRGGMVWDDDAHVTRPELRGWGGLGRIWFEIGATQQYYPVLHSAFWIEHRIWGDATLGYHLANVLLHATACCLLALVLQRLLDGRRPAEAGGRGWAAGWLAAAIFAAHPVCVESVAWISEQKNTLSLVFYLLAGIAYLDFDAGRRPRSYALALALFLLALGTKSVTATLPAAILVVLWWRSGRLSWRRDAAPLLPWFVAALSAGLLTAWVERSVLGAGGARFDLSAAQHLLLAGRVLGFYLGKLAWPAGLTFIYPRWDAAAPTPVWHASLAAAAVVTLALWLIRRRSRGPLAAWLFVGGSLFPALGFFNVYPFLYSYVADHFQYLAALGAIAACSVSWVGLAAAAPARFRAAVCSPSALLVAGLAVLANRQSGMYRDGRTLYQATLARNPACWMAHTNLAVELAKSPGGRTEAIAHLREALRINPDSAEQHYDLANMLATMPEGVPEAIVHYREALRIRPDHAEAHNNFGSLLARLPGREPEAIAQYEEALRIRPGYALAHNNLAARLARIPGRESEALTHFEEALRIQPDYVQAHDNLGILLARQGRLDEARAHWEAALALAPDDPVARRNLGALGGAQKR